MIFPMDEGAEVEETLLSRLSGPTKLERDRALTELRSKISEDPDFLPNFFIPEFSTKIASPLRTWEEKCGILFGAKEILLSPSLPLYNDLSTKIRDFSCSCIFDEEVRVRSAAGKVLGLCVSKYPQYYEEKVQSILLTAISEDLNRSSGSNTSDQSILHDTAGWRYLETSLECLRSIVEEMRPLEFVLTHKFLNAECLGLILESTKHSNRFVRETAFFTIGSLVSVSTHGDDYFAKALSLGLADNWSQVRMSAVVGVRTFLLTRSKSPNVEEYYSLLLPRLCLNRYYLAEGVRIYSQETWKIVVGDQGKALVERYLLNMVDFYVESAEADNHAVREAACHCIAEVVKKLDHDELEPYIPRLLNTLIQCFRDDSWPVRDTACLACEAFILNFPDIVWKSLEILKPLFLENLKDPISSVRQGGASALASCVRAFGKDIMLEFLVPEIHNGLKGVQDQPKETSQYGAAEGTAELSRFGIADKRVRDNDINLHENQIMYSCGSLAPKMTRGGGGCSDGGKFRKPSEPWERADGVVHLLAECSSLCEEEVTKFLLEVVEATRCRHYSNHNALIESFVKRLPEIAKNIGKSRFKPVLEDLFEPIFYALNSDHQLASSAAEYCIQELSLFLGRNIFRGRVEQYNPVYLTFLDRHDLNEGHSSVSRPIDVSIRKNDESMSNVHLGGTPT